MATKTEKFTIGEDTYRITQLGAEVGSDLWDDILAAVGSKVTAQLDKISGALQGLGEQGLDKEKAQVAIAAVLGPVLLDVLATVPKDLKRRWRKLFTETTTVITGAAELNMAEAKLFDQYFAGRYGAMTAWELTCLKHNFLGFLPSKPKSGSSDAGSQ